MSIREELLPPWMRGLKPAPIDGLADSAAYKRGAERRMAAMDALPREWRLFVHEYGLKTALGYRRRGFKTPAAALRHLTDFRLNRDLNELELEL